MNKLFKIILISIMIFSFSFNAFAYVSVKGYTRKDGTYVAPHVRSNPNGLKYDNYGYKPSQGLYNPSYGTKGSSWDTPTYITDPDYYLGKSLYESGLSGSNKKTSTTSTYSYPTTTSASLPKRNVSYVVKNWVENNPSSPCNQSTFLRAVERLECETYKSNINSYTWEATVNEFNNKHYIYNPDTKITTSCPDGYTFKYNTNTGKIDNLCYPEVTNTTQSLPKGCTSSIGFSPINGVSCSSGNQCGLGLKWNGLICIK